jgi:LacI family transcriptional regulator
VLSGGRSSMNNTEQSSDPTIKDIARAARVSISTVSRVLNGSTPVAEETATRVWAAVKQLDFTPNSAARRLASKRTNTVGLLLPEIGGTFFPPMLRGIERCVNQHGFDLLIYSSGLFDRQGPPRPRPLGEHNTDGLLVFTTSLENAEIIRFHRRNFPMVLLHRSGPPGTNIPSVRFENRSSSEKLVDHLIEVHGCRRIVFMRGPAGNEDSLAREEGYRISLEKHHLYYDAQLIETANFDTQSGIQATKRLLKRGILFDAIFAGDDETAAGALVVLAQAGMRVPEQVHVAGFDDNPIAHLLTVPLTTIRADIEQAGFEAARQLISLIQTGKADAMETVLPTELIIRRSCGCKES